MSVVEDVQAYLTAAAIVDGATGWPSSRRAMHDQSDQLVVIREDGGTMPEIGRAEGIGSAAFKDEGVHITVRAAQWDGDSSAAKALEIFEALHGLTGVSMGSGIYDRVVALTSGPVFAGFDGNGRPLHTIGVRLASTVGEPA